MIVTQIESFDKKRSKVYVDETYAFLLYKGEIRELFLQEGEEISEEDYRKVLQEILPLRCKKRAMHLLEKRDYTEHGLRDKLMDGAYPEEIIDEAVEYVKSYGYIDDRRYARDYAAYQVDYRSRQRISQDLMKKGISSDIIRKVLAEVYEEADPEIELQQIRALIAKRHYNAAEADLKEQQRMIGFLMRRGYSMEAIRRSGI